MGVLRTLPLALIGLLAACAAQTTRWDKDFEPAPQQVQADWQLARQRCSSCHELDRIFLNLHLFEDRGDVQLLVEDMAAERGSGIRKSEIEPITNALEWHRTRE